LRKERWSKIKNNVKRKRRNLKMLLKNAKIEIVNQRQKKKENEYE
jgi:hypothetical protein